MNISTKKFQIIVILLALIALIFRLLVSNDLYNNDRQVTKPNASTDMATYIKLANQVNNGTFDKEFDYQPFYYTVFLQVVKVFTHSIWGVIFAQALLGALTVYITAQIAAILFGRISGIFTALLVTCSKSLILYTPYHLIASLNAFWISLLLLLLLLTLKKQNIDKYRYWIGSGIIAGCAILIRGNALLFLPGIIFLMSKINYNKKYFYIVIFAVFTFLSTLPFIYHNSSILGKLSGPSVAGSKVLSLGNTPEAPPGGMNPIPSVPGPMEYPATHKAWSNSKESSFSMHLIKWIKRDPLGFLELQFRKLLLFWDYREIPNNIALGYQGDKSKILPFVGLFPTSIILALAIAGLMSISFKKRKNQHLLNIIITYWLATSAFYILARFRLPLLPILAIPSGYFLRYVLIGIKSYKEKNANYANIFKKIIIRLGFAIFIVFFSYEIYRNYYEKTIKKIIQPNGLIIPLSKSKTVILDHGPFSFGGWLAINPNNKKITKCFAFDGIKSKKTEFSLKTLILKQSTKIKLTVNGHSKEYLFKNTGIKDLIISLPFKQEINIEMQIISGEAVLFFDSQRDYGRTKVNNKDVPYELICRIIYFN